MEEALAFKTSSIAELKKKHLESDLLKTNTRLRKSIQDNIFRVFDGLLDELDKLTRKNKRFDQSAYTQLLNTLEMALLHAENDRAYETFRGTYNEDALKLMTDAFDYGSSYPEFEDNITDIGKIMNITDVKVSKYYEEEGDENMVNKIIEELNRKSYVLLNMGFTGDNSHLICLIKHGSVVELFDPNGHSPENFTEVYESILNDVSTAFFENLFKKLKESFTLQYNPISFQGCEGTCSAHVLTRITFFDKPLADYISLFLKKPITYGEIISEYPDLEKDLILYDMNELVRAIFMMKVQFAYAESNEDFKKIIEEIVLEREQYKNEKEQIKEEAERSRKAEAEAEEKEAERIAQEHLEEQAQEQAERQTRARNLAKDLIKKPKREKEKAEAEAEAKAEAEAEAERIAKEFLTRKTRRARELAEDRIAERLGPISKRISEGLERQSIESFDKEEEERNHALKIQSLTKPEKPSMKRGGVVKGRKNKPVPIIAHGGELVVPVEVVPKVLRSNAWIQHVKAVQKEHGVSYKQAMNIAKGTYRK